MVQASEDKTLECTSADGLRLHVYRWLPQAPARALVIVIHGFVEHAGRYEEMASALNEAAIAVCAADLRGHGLSEGNRVWIDSFDHYVDDLHTVVSDARTAHPELPCFLVGHSMGALIALRFSLAESNGLTGLVLSAPPLSVAEGLFPWLRKLAAFGSRWFPRLRLARMGSAMLSRDADVVARFRADPLVFHGRIPTRTGAEILRVSEETRRQASEVTSPMLILQGTADAVVSPQATEDFYRAAASGDKTLRIYRGLYHDLPREPEKEEICAEVTNWIVRRC